MRLAFAYVTDERGFELACYSATSLALSQRQPCDIHIFCYQFSPRVPAAFAAAMSDLRANVRLHDISDKAVEHYPTYGHVTTPTLLKPSAVAKLVGDYDRIVYFDNDILIFDDLMVEVIDFGTAPLAAVIDMDLSDTGWLRHSMRPDDINRAVNSGRYFNAGFLAFESRNWRQSEFAERYAIALDQHHIACRYKLDCTSGDQCALNSAFENNWLELPASYNMQTPAKYTAAWQTATVRHYCGTRKFIPVSLFRNDGRDIRHMSKIRRALGLAGLGSPCIFECAFRVNAARKYRSDLPIRRLLREIQGEFLAAGVPPGLAHRHSASGSSGRMP